MSQEGEALKEGATTEQKRRDKVHNIFGDRFISNREPAWHKLGLVLNDPINAQDAFLRMGPYKVTTEPLETTKERIAIPDRLAIMRRPTQGDAQTRCFGIVSSDYVLIDPWQFVSLWDRTVRKPIETIGCLGHGETIFVTTKLPKFDVKGDEIDSYMLAVNTMDGTGVARVRATPVRVVCQNTLMAAERVSGEAFKVIHKGEALAQLEGFLKTVWGIAQSKADALKEAFDIMTTVRVTERVCANLLDETYPLVGKPPTENVVELEVWEKHCIRTQESQYNVREIFNGRGLGADTPAAKGTGFGFYNAVVEYEDYGRKGGSKGTYEARVFGRRAESKTRAYNAVMDLVNG